MSKLVIDSYAWIEYLDGTQLGREVADYLEGNGDTFTCTITIAEIISKAVRKRKDANFAYDIVTSNSTVVRADEELSKQAGLIHSEMRKIIKDFGLADAYILATARTMDAKVLTGDTHFKNIKEAIMLK